MIHNLNDKTVQVLACGFVLAALCTPSPAIAQEPIKKTLVEEILIEEIIVTATMREAGKQTLAGNTATLDDMDFLSLDHVSEGLNRLPGVNIQRGNGQEHLTSIRSPILTSGAGAGSFLYLEDGVPLRSPGFANVNGLFEAHIEQASRIEVVRGPGSALYGSNAVHGMINVLTQNPLTSDGSRVDLNWGSHNQATGKFRFLIQGDESTAGLLDMTFKRDDGYREDSGYDQQKVTLRSDWGKGSNRFTFVASFNNLNQETAGFIRGFEAYKDKALAKSNPNPEAYRNAKAYRAQLRWDKELSEDLTLSITPYVRKTEMDFLMHFLPGQAIEVNEHKSFGVQSKLYKNLPNDNLLIAGLDFEYTEGLLYETQPGPSVFSFVTGDHYDYDVTALLVSPFVHTEWNITDKTKVTAGLRLDYTVYNYDNNLANDTVGRFQRISDREDNFTTATPKVGLTHAVKDELSLFALYARGQRAPQTTDLYRIQVNQTPGDAEPELIDSIELGVRDAVGPLRFELSVYVMKKDNFFFRDSDGFNVPDGKTLHRGVEFSFSAQPKPQFDVSGSVTYGVHTYAFDNLVAANSTEDIRDGDDMDTAPRLLSNFRLGWLPTRDIRAEIEWAHMDSYYVDGANDNEYEGHDLINLRATWSLSEIFSIYGRVLNVLDTEYADRADFAFGSYRYFPGEERFFSFGVNAKL
jgi:iron complex outermembrane recepter protein